MSGSMVRIGGSVVIFDRDGVRLNASGKLASQFSERPLNKVKSCFQSGCLLLNRNVFCDRAFDRARDLFLKCVQPLAWLIAVCVGKSTECQSKRFVEAGDETAKRSSVAGK